MSFFEFSGTVESSKSLVNRALIIASYQPAIELKYQSSADDVKLLKTALRDFHQGATSFQCGAAGTTFRFLCLRLSREPGTWVVQGTRRLLSRPQTGLLELLQQLGVKVERSDDRWILHSQGWTVPHVIRVAMDESSQFASALLLNAWNLSTELRLQISTSRVSQSYLAMTLKMVTDFGMKVEDRETDWIVKMNQTPHALKMELEADVSSCFALAACGIQNGNVTITNFPNVSSQPDGVFVEYLKQMGALIELKSSELIVQRSQHLKPLAADLTSTPDLFPILAVLCARAEGVSQLSGLSHLSAKESDRLQGTIRLLNQLGRETTLDQWTLRILGRPEAFSGEGIFDPDQDHRMAMAAQVANFYGARLKIKDPRVVDKSFPQFWQNVGVSL